MAISRSAWAQLKSVTADDLIRALERDGWIDEDRRGATLGYVKNTTNGTGRKRIVIHYHPRKTFGANLLKALINSTGWTTDDLKRLKLVRKK